MPFKSFECLPPSEKLQRVLDEMSEQPSPRSETHNGKAISLTDEELRHKLAGTRVIMSVCKTCDKLLQDDEECCDAVFDKGDPHGPP